MSVKTMPLPVKLTDEKLLEVAGEMSQLLIRRDKMDLRRTRAAKLFRDRITDFDDKIRLKNQALSTGYEEHLVEIEETDDLFAGERVTRRMDSFDVVMRRPLREDERQLSLGVAAAKAAAGGAAEPDNVVPMLLKAPEAGGGKAGERARREQREMDEAQAEARTPEEAEAIRESRMDEEAAEKVTDLSRPPPDDLACADEWHQAPIAEGVCPSCSCAF